MQGKNNITRGKCFSAFKCPCWLQKIKQLFNNIKANLVEKKMSQTYYTHGSIENVSIHENVYTLHIKPINEFEAVIKTTKYLVFVKDLDDGLLCYLENKNNKEPASFLINRNEGLPFFNTIKSDTIEDKLLLDTMIPYWMTNKTKLKFTGTIFKKSDGKTELKIISIEPIE